MSYEIVLGNLGPVFPLTLTANGVVFALDNVNDTVKLRYLDPNGSTHEVTMTITSAVNGQVSYTWINGDLPVAGVYRGLVTVTRAADPTFPRTFPSDGNKIIWWVYPTI